MNTKKTIVTLVCILFVFMFYFTVPISARYDLCSEYNAGDVYFISYSTKWDEEKLKALYAELINNFHGEEFGCLNAVYLYPDSPYGVKGHYYDDIEMIDGEYRLGDKAYIELFDMDKTDTVEAVSRTLSHEYGHHYTIYNITSKEGKYCDEWADTEYARLRGLSQYPVYYKRDVNVDNYRWDAAEIIADDYVQLLGSSTARLCVDIGEIAEDSDMSNVNFGKYWSAFNIMPQKNPSVRLAADVDGLYEYLHSLCGYTTGSLKKGSAPRITGIEMKLGETDKEYTVRWSEAEGNEPYEYTLIMYPKDNPIVPIPVKTVKTGEQMCAASVYGATDKNSYSGFEGDYEFVVLYTDKDGFIRRSEPYEYSFGYEEFVKDDYVGNSSDYVPRGNIDYSKISIDEDINYKGFFEQYYSDLSEKVSFKKDYYDIIKKIDLFFA